MSTHNSMEFVRLLTKDLYDVQEDAFKSLPNLKDTFFKTITSDKAWEEFYSVGGVPDITPLNGKLTSLHIAPGFWTRVSPTEYGNELIFERKFLDDNQYDVMKDQAAGLVKSMGRVIEKKAAGLFTGAFSTSYDFMTNEEGVSLCSTAHTTKSGTSTSSGFSNAGTSTLSATSLAATWILMKQFRNDISERIDISNNLAIVVPTNLYDTASEIVGTEKGLDTPGQNVNMQSYRRYKVIAHPLLDDVSTQDWYMVDLDQLKKDAIWINKVAPETKNTFDWETYALRVAIYARFGYGWRDWRGIYGHNVS